MNLKFYIIGKNFLYVLFNVKIARLPCYFEVKFSSCSFLCVAEFFQGIIFDNLGFFIFFMELSVRSHRLIGYTSTLFGASVVFLSIKMSFEGWLAHQWKPVYLLFWLRQVMFFWLNQVMMMRMMRIYYL